MKFFAFFAFFVIVCTALGAPGEEDNLETKRLTKLTQKEQVAGMNVGGWGHPDDEPIGGNRLYHPKWRSFVSFYNPETKKYENYHGNGDLWPQSHLEEFFKHGLLYFYVKTEKKYGADLDMNYAMLLKCEFVTPRDQDKINQIAKFLGLPKYESSKKEACLSPVVNGTQFLRDWQESVWSNLSLNKPLMTLGATFQREKIVVEKQMDILHQIRSDAEDEKKAAFNKLMELDRRNTDAQTLIFHWVRYTCEMAFKRLCEIVEKKIDFSEPVNFQETYGQDPLWQQIRETQPEFAAWPVYKALME